ncbi:MAG: exo-alpha-sialidase, partial [Flavobacteriia bacterium]|nr:exo-alpha-sialidase [Flavobacteriia bacterium]
MKSKRFIFLFTVLFGISAFILISKFDFESKNGSYFQKELSGFMSQTGGNEAQEWLRARYIDVTTGQTVTTERLAEIDKQIRKLSKSKSISFIEQGPDNIGGRTRAVLVNRNNINEVWAGSVSGGLFYSNNKGSNWSRVDSYAAALASPNISSMTQTADGTLFIATGSNQESGSGNGVWYSTDNGATWQKIPGTTECTEVVSASESSAIPYAWLATAAGLKKWKVGDAGLTGATVTTGACTALKISPDGNVIVAAFGSSKTYVSNDAGVSFADKSGNSTGATTVPVGAGRIEYAISSMKNSSNKYSIYAV